MSTNYPETALTRLRRLPTRGTYDRETVHAILDEALVCHLSFATHFATDGQPCGLPTTFVRDGESLVVHGSAASRMMKSLAGGTPVCVTVTIVDGLVLARSAFHHSMNYRSVVVFGTATEIAEADEKRRALALLVEKVSPGRSARVRAPSDKELRVTTVLNVPIEAVSAKIRTGPPIEEAGDMDLPVWAGVVPLSLHAGAPLPDGDAVAAFEPPSLPRGV
jgi:hypothetical protein